MPNKPTAQESLNPGDYQKDAYGFATDVSAGDHLGNYPAAPRAFKLNIASCDLLVKLQSDDTAVKGYYLQGVDYPRAALNIQKYSGGSPIALAAGDVTLIF